MIGKRSRGPVAALRRSVRGKGGRPAFAPVLMFKILVPETHYSLSDEATEFQIKDRLSFQWFRGLGLDGTVPDATTVWLLRERLVKVKPIKVFARFDTALTDRAYRAMGEQIIDATVVPAPKRRNTEAEMAAIKEGRATIKIGKANQGQHRLQSPAPRLARRENCACLMAKTASAPPATAKSPKKIRPRQAGYTSTADIVATSLKSIGSSRCPTCHRLADSEAVRSDFAFSRSAMMRGSLLRDEERVAAPQPIRTNRVWTRIR